MESQAGLPRFIDQPTVTPRQRFAALLRHWLAIYGVILVGYILITSITNAHFQGDTIWYAQQIRAGKLWESGHLLWRPLGLVAHTLIGPLTRLAVGGDEQTALILSMLVVNWVTGLASVLLFYDLLRRLFSAKWIPLLTTVTFAFAQAFLNYIQTGSSYTTALACLITGLYLGIRGGQSPNLKPWWALGAGAAIAGAICFWLPFMFAAPAAVLAPLLLFGFTRRRLWFVTQIGVVGAAVTLAVYVVVALNLGIDDVASFRKWMLSASRGSTTGGVERMVLGFARSFLNMGSDGVVFKRFLLNDPYNPVSLAELFATSLWKLGLFYGFIGAVLASLVKSTFGRRVLAVFAVAVLPLLAFAAFWQGGDMERYLALYPFVFLALAGALASERPFPLLRWIVGAYLVTEIVSSLGVMAIPQLDRRQEAANARMSELLPILKPGSVVMVLVQQDDVWQFNHSFPFNPVFRERGEFVDELPSTRWRERFGAQVLEVWGRGGDMWLSKRLLAERPQPEWNWVEGVDKQRSWTDITTFFQPLDRDNDVGGTDGFVRLSQTPANEQLMRGLAQQ